ncbi:MAG: NAD(P)/FAD-dependent oxidoreductase [Thermodesulfobacteriota bacterium]|nr:NAD(P)/FAD-dependent oxidoreductase [Thermodesulfobacteriota bacterium]
MPDYDVIVIGAGNGGLTASASLAKRGAKVLLMERHNLPGGCATSFIRGRFEFEVALHQLSGLGTPEQPGPLRGLLGQLDVLDKIEFTEEDTLYKSIIPDQFEVTIKADRAEAIAALKEKFPDEADAIDRFFDLVWEFCMQMVSIFFMKDPEASREKYPTYCKYAIKSSKEVLDGFFKNPLLKLAISSYWGYIGLPPSRLTFSDLAMLLWAYIEFKPFHIKGGSQAMSNAILDTFIQAGGYPRFNCGAKKIIISDGKVKGVVTETGEEITCDYVVSNASTITTYVELLGEEHIPEDKLKMLGSRSVGPSGFSVYCGLDCEPQDLGIDVSTQFISLNTDIERQFATWRTFDKPEMCGMTCYDFADPDFSPAGACQVVLINLQFADHWLTIPPSQYADAKYRYAQELINIAERVYPGFTDAMEEVDVSSPITHLRYLGHPGGGFYGFEKYAKDSNLFIAPTSGIDGLYFAGAWAGMAGFQPTLESGVSAAKAIYRKMNE